MQRVRPYSLWRAQRENNGAWVARVNAAMEANARDRLRDAEKARLLCERGTPPARVGAPVEERPDTPATGDR